MALHFRHWTGAQLVLCALLENTYVCTVVVILFIDLDLNKYIT